MDEKPLDYSTPKHVHVRGRPPIRDQESFQSPIENFDDDDKDNIALESESPSEWDSNDISEDSDSEDKSRSNLRERQSICIPFALVIACVSIFLFGLYRVNEVETKSKNFTIDELEKDFPTQVNDFWLSIKVAISEVNRAHRPKSIIFLYQNDGIHTLNGILKGIASVAVCEITSCSSEPIIFEEGELNTTDLIEDYGKIIAENKEQLQERGVMVIKNLETIPGVTAQAFHSLCDEFNPVVQKALFLFTMKVDSFKSNNIKAIENQLQSSWSDLKDDKFYPLFTRISDFVLPVTSEY